MAELKTKPTQVSVYEFINQVENEVRRKDCLTVLELMKAATGAEPAMWGPSIIGFGSYHYQYASGHSGDAPLIGFSPRKNALTLYISTEASKFKDLLARLGKHKFSGGACLYLNKLADVDQAVLKELIDASVEHMAPQRTDR